jgi:hypothetical protein
MMFSISFFVTTIFIGVVVAADTNTERVGGHRLLWRDDLLWEQLISSLSANASLIDASPSNYLEECSPEYDKLSPNQSNQ